MSRREDIETGIWSDPCLDTLKFSKQWPTAEVMRSLLQRHTEEAA